MIIIAAALLLFAYYLIHIGQWRVIVTFLFMVCLLAGLPSLIPLLFLAAGIYVFSKENSK